MSKRGSIHRLSKMLNSGACTVKPNGTAKAGPLVLKLSVLLALATALADWLVAILLVLARDPIDI